MNTDRYIEKWLNGTLSDEERARFEETDAFKELKKLSDAVQQFRAPEFDTELQLNRLNQNKQGKGRQINWQKTLLRVAAMLTIVVGGYFYYTYFLPVTIETSMAESKKIILPDSSEVILNALSKITYTERRWDNHRSLELEGEAFFKVKKGSTFDVATSSGTVSVLGTQFNVKERTGYFEVVCYEGLVQVTTPQDNNRLPAYHVIRIIEGEIHKHQFSDESEPAWVHNESAFTSVPFNQVISEFERQYNVKILPQDVKLDKLFTGRFTHDDMILALKSITIPQNISFQITEDQQIILSGEIE